MYSANVLHGICLCFILAFAVPLSLCMYRLPALLLSCVFAFLFFSPFFLSSIPTTVFLLRKAEDAKNEEEKRYMYYETQNKPFFSVCEYKYVIREENERKMFNLKMRYHCHFIEKQAKIPTNNSGTKQNNTLCFVGRARRVA